MTNGLGNGDNGEFTFMDLKNLSERADTILNEIHEHLRQQDDKLDYILKELNNDSRRGIQ